MRAGRTDRVKEREGGGRKENKIWKSGYKILSVW